LALGGVVAVVVAAMFLGFGYSGMAPWSGDLPGYHPAVSSTVSTISYSSAARIASGTASGVTGAPWGFMSAVGIDSSTSIQLPNPTNSTGISEPIAGCGLTGPPPSFTIPASSGAVGFGLAAAWLFEAQNQTGAILVIGVLNGVPSVLAQSSGSSCSMPGVSFTPIAANVLDSTSAAGIANAWGGSAFLANHSASIAVYEIVGSYSFQLSWSPPPPGLNGSGTGNFSPPPPVPVNYSYSSPSLWGIMDSTCFPFNPSTSGTMASFSASLAPVNGTVLSASAYVSYSGCSSPLVPPGPVYSSPPGEINPP
jgi:hypothetical protein